MAKIVPFSHLIPLIPGYTQIFREAKEFIYSDKKAILLFSNTKYL